MTLLASTPAGPAPGEDDFYTACGFPPSFEDLAVPLWPDAYRFAFRLTRCEADAQDLVQESFLKAFRAFAGFAPGSNFRAWIFRILKNTYLTSLVRADKRYAASECFDDLLTQVASDHPDPLSLLILQARSEAFQSAAQQLPANLHQVLLLCDMEEASYRDAAQVLSIPLGTVMSRLARARKAVRASVHSAGHG